MTIYLKIDYSLVINKKVYLISKFKWQTTAYKKWKVKGNELRSVFKWGVVYFGKFVLSPMSKNSVLGELQVLKVRNAWVTVEWVEKEERSVVCIKAVVKRKGRDQSTKRGGVRDEEYRAENRALGTPQTLDTFRKHLKTHLFQSAFNSP